MTSTMKSERPSVRHRLRFHLQEVDLPDGKVVLGRGSECQITIDDPMLSRRHARIDLGPEGPTIEDLQSRNGTQLNGAALVGRAALQDGDRIRIGTQELVFVTDRSSVRNPRTTSGLVFCAACAVPYPSRSSQCPHCGEAAAPGTTVDRDVPASSWTFHLLAQVVGRAIEQGRLADAERMLTRGLSELEQRLRLGAELDPAHIVGIADCATRLGCALGTSRWVENGAKLYAQARAQPSPEVLALLERQAS